MELTPETRTDLVYLREPMSSVESNYLFNDQGEPKDTKIRTVVKVMGKLGATKVGSGHGEPSRM